MELMELYNQIQNPIDDPQVIKKLITAYANSSGNWSGFYNQLIKTVKKQWVSEKHYAADRDKFYSMMFNKWKNNIVAMTRAKPDVYVQDFTKLGEYLKDVPDVSTQKETHDVFFGSKNDKELEDAIKKYRWTKLGEYSSWRHVCSHYVTMGEDPYPNIEHRLYLNTEIMDTYKMITYLVEKCDEYHLPYYFKFDPDGDRDDTIVIYSSTENLTKYVEILQEIKREHPELVDKAKEPPILTGKIDGWIGYGSEPSKTPDGKRRSFNEVRSKAIVPVIAQLTKQWVGHRRLQITYQGKTDYLDNFAESDLEEIIRNLSAEIAKIDPNFVLSVQEQIKSSAKQYGINPDKFCFDIKTKEKMRTMSAQIETDTPVNGRIR